MTIKIQDHYENLASLYLRLNGFVTSNLILHSDVYGNEKSELDHIAFRMPLHHQTDRNEPTSSFLDLPKDRIQIVIGDSKSTTDKEKVRYNKGLRKDRGTIIKLAEWIGLFNKIDDEVIDNFELKLSQKLSNKASGFNRYDVDTEFGKFQITFLFFCPLLERSSEGELKYIHGQEMIEYCYRCLNEEYEPIECTRTYGLKHWHQLKRYVTYFKEAEFAGTIYDFEAKFKN